MTGGAVVATSGGVELREKCLFFACAFQKEGLGMMGVLTTVC